MRKSTFHVLAPIMMCVVATLGIASAEQTPSSQAKAEIRRILDGLEGQFVRGDNATELAKSLYNNDLTIVGEADAGSKRGMKAAIEDAQEWLDSLGPNGVKTCRYTIIEPVVASETTFSSFMLLHCKANPPSVPKDQDTRMMYIWKKYPQEGWRVVLEMWAPGKF